MGQTINSQQLQIGLTQNSLLPDEGPKIIPVDLDFTVSDSYFFDGELVQAQNKLIQILQSIYADNRANTIPLTMVIEGSRQRIDVPAATQGYYTVLSPNPIRITFTSIGGAAVRVHLLNVPVPGSTWRAA